MRAALQSGYPEYPADRVDSSLTILLKDLDRQLSHSFRFERNVLRTASDSSRVMVPILATRLVDGRESWIALSSPVAAGVPVDAALRAVDGWPNNPIICVDDLMVRRHLPAAVKELDQRLRWK